MNKKKVILILAAVVGLMGTTAAVGARGMVDKVSGLLRKDVSVSINGEHTSLHPVYINGKAYLPVRDAAPALGYNVSYNGKEIELNEIAEEEAVEYMRTMGVIVDVQKTKDGQYRIEVLGKGPQSWVILFADKDTVLTDADGKPFAAKNLKAGQRIIAEFGPIMTMSFPGQSHAATINVRSDSLIKESTIQAVEHTDDGWQVKFGETKNGVETTTLVVNAGKETTLLDAQGQSVTWESLKPGMKVRAYYGPAMTKSLPPQSPLHYLVLLDAAPSLAPAAVKEFQDIAWALISAGEKPHLTTKKEEAKVEFIPADGAPLFGGTDAQKKRLEELKAAGGQIVTVTYTTDRDALIGPLVMAFDPDTKQLLGYFIRK
ncbi:hypothetical protein [Cohnella yongneupensis]|uniref:Copper amine oxidase-like N-terminal domain-containing protein n=1 Tax=Cohnella yongneupensis TaxID=425006 RepID=A0ABW0R1I5_9BACL